MIITVQFTDAASKEKKINLTVLDEFDERSIKKTARKEIKNKPITVLKINEITWKY